MTVINMLSFGDEGVAVADEQSSNLHRKYNVAQKLRILDDSYVYGGSGPSDCLKEIYDLISERVTELKKQKPNLSLKEVYQLAQQNLVSHKNDFKNKFLLANIGIGLGDFLGGTFENGRQKISDPVYKQADSFIRHIDETYNTSFLLGGIRDEKFEIYFVGSNHPGSSVSRHFDSIGSGSDESDKVMASYVAKLSREKRDAIDKQEGLVKIIEATNASSNLNIGVGGSPSIVYVPAGKQPIRPNERQCVLASELVEGLTNGLLPKDFVYDKVSELVYSNGDFERIEEDMQRNSTDWKKLDRILRGYKE